MAGIQASAAPTAAQYPKHLPPPGAALTPAQLIQLDGAGWRLELVDGRLVVMSPAGFVHGQVCHNIQMALGNWQENAGLGAVLSTDTGTLLSNDRVRAPDAMWISDETLRRAQESKEAFLPGAPELAVEVLSPNDTYSETLERITDQLQNGGKQVWLVDPRKRWLEIHSFDGAVVRLTEKDTVEGGDLMPGLSIPVARFFKGLPSGH